MRPFPIQLTRAQQRRPKKPMPDQEIKPGAVVQLKSGGPNMTVSTIRNVMHEGTVAKCHYFSGEKARTVIVSPEALRLSDNANRDGSGR